MKHLILFVLLNCFYTNHVQSVKLPGPSVYVVTPSSKPQIDMGRAAPFYYHNWKRMDTPSSAPTTSSTEKTKTPDLIFAEFESGNNNVKSIRKILEEEKVKPKTTTTTTSRPIYVPDEDTSDTASNYGLPQPTTEKAKKTDMTDYFALYNNMYNSGPVFVPNSPSSVHSTSTEPTTTTTTTTQAAINNVENIWHIIDNEKYDEYAGKWEEVPVNDEQTNSSPNEDKHPSDEEKSNESSTDGAEEIDDNFALPGFGTNPGNGGENESRAIRTESNIRFPYVNLKPFKMKNFNSKKANNMFNLNGFTEIKNPVRGEVQDTQMVPMRQPIDRYNPAQSYLPDFTKTKPSSSYSGPSAPAQAPAPPPRPPSPPAPRPPPVKAVANLVPPPIPPSPKLTSDDFPSPATYESFPPFAPSGPGSGSSFSFPMGDDSGPDSSSSDDDGPPLGYRYKPPAPPAPPAAPPAPAPPAPAPAFVPTLPPMSKPFAGYSYDKPPMMQDDSPPGMDMEDHQGYHYNKPAAPPVQDYSPPSYGHHDAPPPSYQPEHDYPDLIYDKPHGGHGMKGGDDMKGYDMGMMPPPPDMKPDSDGSPMDDHDHPPDHDHGYSHDFPSDFKYAHDFDDHDFHHHYHHTTTTTSTEMPRVNRYSYYYLGKKLYYLPLYFSVYFVIYVGALIIKAVLRHKITYPNSFRPNDQTATFFSKRSIDSHLSNENLHEITGRVTKAIASAAEKYVSDKSKED